MHDHLLIVQGAVRKRQFHSWVMAGRIRSPAWVLQAAEGLGRAGGFIAHGRTPLACRHVQASAVRRKRLAFDRCMRPVDAERSRGRGRSVLLAPVCLWWGATAPVSRLFPKVSGGDGMAVANMAGVAGPGVLPKVNYSRRASLPGLRRRQALIRGAGRGACTADRAALWGSVASDSACWLGRELTLCLQL